MTQALQARFEGVEVSSFRGDTRVCVSATNLLEVLRYLRQDAGCDMLVDITCVDYSELS